MWKLAWRNLWRNRTRTFVVLSALVFSYALMLLFMGIGDDMHGNLEETAVEVAGGHVLVHGDGYWDSQASDLLIDHPHGVEEVASSMDHVETVIPRVIIDALASTSRGNEPVRLVGVVPEKEFQLADVSKDLEKGAFFSDEYDAPIVLRRSLVEEMELELGDKVVITASDADGELARALFRLDGILKPAAGEQADRLAYTTLAAAQDAVKMQGRLTQIGLVVDQHELRDEVARALRDRLVVSGTSAGALEIMTWDEALPELVGFIEIDDAFAYIYIAVIFIVVAFAIANTFLMAVMERVREFGLLNAIGLTPGRIGRLVLAETLLLTVIGVAAGFVLAYAGHMALVEWGIDMSAFLGGEEVDLELSGVGVTDMIIRSEIRPTKWIVGTGAVFVVVLPALSTRRGARPASPRLKP